MDQRLIAPVSFGLIGAAILVGLGLWQLERLQWKAGVLAQIDAMIVGEPVEVPLLLNEAAHQFLPVIISGMITVDELHVLASVQKIGPGYRIIAAFEMDGGRRILLDRGFVALTAKEAARPATRATITGNLHWPDEMGSAIPEPDLKRDIWFARDIAAMAQVLHTEPVLVVQRSSSEASLVTTPFPLSSTGIPNRHLEYVVTWFGLAIAWLGMTGYLIWRIRRGND